MLTAADKRWLRKFLKEEIRSLLEDMIEGQVAQMGGYDGATDCTEDEWAEEGKPKRRRIGFSP